MRTTLHKILVVFALVAGCTSRSGIPSAVESGFVASDEDRYYATQAALLDPRCYHLITAVDGTLDVTVPDGHSWRVANAFAVTYGDPVIVAQDAWPGVRRSGFVRPLDVRRGVTLPTGTRVRRNDDNTTDSYLYYCDPDDVWGVDARYTADPKGLYFGRIVQLESMPLRDLVLEATGGGAITDDLHVEVPGDGPILVVGASVYDASWATLGWVDDLAHSVNLEHEINNSHSMRTGEGLLAPMPRGAGLVFTLCKGSTSDTPGSTDPAVAYPIKGSGSLLYHDLPSDW